MALLALEPAPIANAEVVHTFPGPDGVLGAAQTMVELHFVTRDRIADFLSSPRSDTLIHIHMAVQEFLEAERHLLLRDPATVEELGVDIGTLLRGRRAVRRALSRVVWSDAGTVALARATETLRLAFIEHATLYGQLRSASHRPRPIPLPAATHRRSCTIDLLGDEIADALAER